VLFQIRDVFQRLTPLVFAAVSQDSYALTRERMFINESD
jgi:hypothetical protein